MTFSIYILLSVISLTSIFNQMRSSYDSLENFSKMDIFKLFEDYDYLIQKSCLLKGSTQTPDSDKTVMRKFNELNLSLLAEIPVALYHLRNYDDSLFGVLSPSLKKAEELLKLVSENVSKTAPAAKAAQDHPDRPNSNTPPTNTGNPDSKDSCPSSVMPDASNYFQSNLQIRRSLQEKMSILWTYILPMLYGLLGSSVFIMRSILGGNYNFTIFQFSASALILRISLGGISGLVIGWFTLTQDASKLTTTPFAVAFIAGFSIEILFSLLDRFIIALGPAKPG